MRITKVRISRVLMPRTDPAWRTASYAATSVDGFFLEVEAGGMTGLGATAAHPSQISGDDLQRQLEGAVSPALVGAELYEGAAIRQRLASMNVSTRARVAADLALHDLTGRLAGLPCYALWGGRVRTAVEVVRMVGIKTPDELVPHVRGLVEEGHSHFKIKVGTGVAEDVERIARLRSVFGGSIWIGVDGNGAYDVDDATELCRKLEPYDVRLVEQPIPAVDIDGLARLTSMSPIPIMADQNVTDVASALTICQKHAAHVVSIKATKMGSIEECRRVAELCLAFGVGVHIGGVAEPALVCMAQTHLALTMPGIQPECEVGEFQAVSRDPTSPSVTIRDGRLEVGEDAGFGVVLARVAAVVQV
ncbi:MAG TPA: mandelate racemase/muconate lactonizing enzyme family protein [Chloroflexota bacterium]|nr:mandelate racemase/muconate lactonizing enzyme family protein [Chloroflexota bacterium]